MSKGYRGREKTKKQKGNENTLQAHKCKENRIARILYIHIPVPEFYSLAVSIREHCPQVHHQDH